MSLDVYLHGPPPTRACSACGHADPVGEGEMLFTANVTHNLTAMAGAAGIYLCLWRPEECSPPITKAHELIEPLTCGLVKLKGDPARFQEFAPSNGWGTHKGLVEFVASYLEACEHYPDATVGVSR